MDHPPPYSDTDPQAMEVWLDILRQKPPHDKIGTVLDLSQFALQMSEVGVRARYPKAGDREVFLRVAARHLSRDLMLRVYGWDASEHEHANGSF